MKKIQIKESDIELNGFMPISKDMIDEAKKTSIIMLDGIEAMSNLLDLISKKAKDENHLELMKAAYGDWIESSKYENSMDKQSLRNIIAKDFNLVESEKEAIAMIIMHSRNHGMKEDARNELIAEFYNAEIEFKEED